MEPLQTRVSRVCGKSAHMCVCAVYTFFQRYKSELNKKLFKHRVHVATRDKPSATGTIFSPLSSLLHIHGCNKMKQQYDVASDLGDRHNKSFSFGLGVQYCWVFPGQFYKREYQSLLLKLIQAKILHLYVFIDRWIGRQIHRYICVCRVMYVSIYLDTFLARTRKWPLIQIICIFQFVCFYLPFTQMHIMLHTYILLCYVGKYEWIHNVS